MSIGDVLVRVTIWLSLLAWVAAEWRRGAGPAMKVAGRRAWTVGAVAAVAHTAAAFHFRHRWSHEDALAETARQTLEVTGMDWGGGLFVNYLFVAVWTADAAWWWLHPEAFARRPRSLDEAVRGFLLFMFVNGAVVFAKGPARAAGAAATLAVLVARYRGWKRLRSAGAR